MSDFTSSHTGPTTTSAYANPSASSGYYNGATRDSAQATANDARGAAHDLSQDARATAYNASQSAQQTASDASRSAQQGVYNASESAKQAGRDVSDAAYDATESARQTGRNVANSAQQTANNAANSAQQTGRDISNAASDATESAKQTGRDVANNAQQAAHNASVSAQQTGRDISNAAQQTAQNASQTAQNVASSAQQTAHDASVSAQQTAQNAKNQAADKLNQAGNKLNQATNTANAKLHQIGEQAAHHPLVQSAQQTTQQQLNVLDQQLARFGFLNEFEARTRIPKTYGVLGFSITTALLILLNLFGLAQPITNFIGWALPAYLTCHALESPQKGDDAQWLCYWIVFGFLNYLESAALRVVLYYVPHYFTLKLAAIVWLMLPQTRGAERVYYSALRPLFQQGRAKAQQINAQTPTNTSTQFGASSSQFGTSAANRFGTTNTSDSYGVSSGLNTHPSSNPFAGASAPGSGLDGMHPTAYARIGGVTVPVVPVAGANLY